MMQHHPLTSPVSVRQTLGNGKSPSPTLLKQPQQQSLPHLTTTASTTIAATSSSSSASCPLRQRRSKSPSKAAQHGRLRRFVDHKLQQEVLAGAGIGPTNRFGPVCAIPSLVDQLSYLSVQELENFKTITVTWNEEQERQQNAKCSALGVGGKGSGSSVCSVGSVHNKEYMSQDLLYRVAAFTQYQVEPAIQLLRRVEARRFHYLSGKQLKKTIQRNICVPLPFLRTKPQPKTSRSSTSGNSASSSNSATTTNGDEIIYLNPSRFDFQNEAISKLKSLLIYVTNAMYEKNYNPRRKMAFLINLTDWNAEESFALDAWLEIMDILQGHTAPVRTSQILLVNPPPDFGRAWKMIRMMCQQDDFADKFQTVQEEDLKNYLAPGYKEHLPNEFQNQGLAFLDHIVRDFLEYRITLEFLIKCQGPQQQSQSSGNQALDCISLAESMRSNNTSTIPEKSAKNSNDIADCLETPKVNNRRAVLPRHSSMRAMLSMDSLASNPSRPTRQNSFKSTGDDDDDDDESEVILEEESDDDRNNSFPSSSVPHKPIRSSSPIKPEHSSSPKKPKRSSSPTKPLRSSNMPSMKAYRMACETIEEATDQQELQLGRSSSMLCESEGLKKPSRSISPIKPTRRQSINNSDVSSDKQQQEEKGDLASRGTAGRMTKTQSARALMSTELSSTSANTHSLPRRLNKPKASRSSAKDELSSSSEHSKCLLRRHLSKPKSFRSSTTDEMTVSSTPSRVTPLRLQKAKSALALMNDETTTSSKPTRGTRPRLQKATSARNFVNEELFSSSTHSQSSRRRLCKAKSARSLVNEELSSSSTHSQSSAGRLSKIKAGRSSLNSELSASTHSASSSDGRQRRLRSGLSIKANSARVLVRNYELSSSSAHNARSSDDDCSPSTGRSSRTGMLNTKSARTLVNAELSASTHSTSSDDGKLRKSLRVRPSMAKAKSARSLALSDEEVSYMPHSPRRRGERSGTATFVEEETQTPRRSGSLMKAKSARSLALSDGEISSTLYSPRRCTVRKARHSEAVTEDEPSTPRRGGNLTKIQSSCALSLPDEDLPEAGLAYAPHSPRRRVGGQSDRRSEEILKEEPPTPRRTRNLTKTMSERAFTLSDEELSIGPCPTPIEAVMEHASASRYSSPRRRLMSEQPNPSKGSHTPAPTRLNRRVALQRSVSSSSFAMAGLLTSM